MWLVVGLMRMGQRSASHNWESVATWRVQMDHATCMAREAGHKGECTHIRVSTIFGQSWADGRSKWTLTCVTGHAPTNAVGVDRSITLTKVFNAFPFAQLLIPTFPILSPTPHDSLSLSLKNPQHFPSYL